MGSSCSKAADAAVINDEFHEASLVNGTNANRENGSSHIKIVNPSTSNEHNRNPLEPFNTSIHGSPKVPSLRPVTKSESDGSSGHSSNGPSDNNKPGWSSGASTPRRDSLDGSTHSAADGNPKSLLHSTSVLGLDKMMEERAAGGDLTNNIVHMEVPFGKPIEEVYEGVHDGPVLGSGISGLVRLCVHKATGAKYAVKCLDLGLVETEEGLQQLREEIAIMCQLDHPNIVRLEEVYESHSEIYLVQELCVGGELFDRLDEQPDYHYSEAQCARLIKQMLCSVRYIHSKGIIHRDLKLENFLFSNVSQDSELKMIDFGLSKHFQYGEVHHDAVGTPYTVSPEVIRGSYDERCDIWAIGVIAYLLLSGDPPFGGCGGPESLFQVRSNILQGKFEFEPEEVWDHISQEAKNFIRTMLVTDPNFRPTAKECQKSHWLHEWANKDKLDTDTRLNANVVAALVNFKEYSDMRKLLCEVLSFTLMPDQITDLRKEFEKLDTDGSGEISLTGLKQVLMQGAGAGSLGALGEEEVNDIFNAMRVRKTETTIHWHEFIAAGLSQCQVDERNLRLAFDRMDSDHKGYITFDNVMALMGRDGAESEDEMKAMWSDSMRECNSVNARITYDDFLLLMKGQTKYCDVGMPPPAGQQPAIQSATVQAGALDILYECTSISEGTEGSDDRTDSFMPSMRRESTGGIPMSPKTSSLMIPAVDESVDIDDIPPSMDDEDDFDQKLSDSADLVMKLKQEARISPPTSPICPPSPGSSILLKGAALSPISDFRRHRSRSLDDQDLNSGFDQERDPPHFGSDIRRAMPLPEHTHNIMEIEKVIHDESLTPLVVNRQLYRAHRVMRLSVLEASKRFEEQQVERTKASIQAKEQAESSSRFGAGLVMRRGHKKEVSSDTIRKLMAQKQEQHETVINDAARKSGRGKRRRKKTISDMSEMMSVINPEEMTMDRAKSQTTVLEIPKLRQSAMEPESELLLHDITKPEPTMPGVFRKTSDPFQTMGKSLMGLLGGNSKKEISEVEYVDHNILKSLGKSKNSNLKLSLSDGELNTYDTPNSPMIDGLMGAEETKDLLKGVPPLPLDLS